MKRATSLLQDKTSIELLGLWSVIILSTFIYSFVSIYKHLHFQTYAWDTSVFIQQLYFLHQFKYPQSTLLNYNVLGDHFQILFLLICGMGYFIWSDPKVLFVLQALIFSLSAVPLYLIGRFFLNQTKIPQSYQTTIILLIVLAYLFNVTSQSMLMDEFHNEPLAALPLMWTLYFLIKKNQIGYWLSFGALLLSKEIFGLLGLPLGIYIYLKQRNLKQAFSTILMGLGFSYFLLFYLMPSLSRTPNYIHFSQGNTLTDLITKFIQKPWLLITEFINDSQKLKTISSSLIYFSFLPLLAIPELILLVFSLAIRFFDDTTPRLYEFNNHYAVPYITFVAFASLVGCFNLIIWTQTKKFNLVRTCQALIILIVGSIIIQNFLYHGPLNSLFKKQFYEFSSWEMIDYELLGKIPPMASVASQNSLLPHLSQREQLYLLPKVENAQYIAADLSDGPNKFSPLNNSAEMKSLLDSLIKEGKYKVVWQKDQALLLKRVYDTNH